MKVVLFAVFLSLLVCANYARSQELFINTPAAANISKGRLELRNNVLGYDRFRYFHNSFDINYGVTGRLTAYTRFYYTIDKKYKFIGDFNPQLRYRFFDKDAKNSHIRFAGQIGARVPIESKPVVGDQVEYELHPGHVVKFYNFVNDITVPVIDFHTTDNYSVNMDLIGTALMHKLAISGNAGYSVNIPKSDFKFGNYFNFGFGAGYLLLPREYTSYNNVNVNLYLESKMYYFAKNKFNGQYITNSGGFRWDGYAGVQTIFFSALILEASYGFPIHSNEFTETKIQVRPSTILISLRYLFFL